MVEETSSVHSTGTTTSPTLLLRVRDFRDGSAWNEFVDRYAPRIFQWCRRCEIQENDAADVTQEVLYKLVRSIDAFKYDRTRGSFRGWLKAVTVNTIRDLARSSKQRDRGSGDTGVARFLSAIEDEQAVERLVDAVEAGYRQELLEDAGRRVRCRVQAHTWTAFQLTAVEQVSAKEAAERLGISVPDVYVAKSRVLKLMRAEIQSLESSLG